jgi:hypothetical protein
MPYGSWINDLPTGFFLTVHVIAFVIGALRLHAARQGHARDGDRPVTFAELIASTLATGSAPGSGGGARAL